ncbi:hypothetical protein GmHk_05G013001 [Glycine max]|nr:hypothetical protein GmHk_05G013001 [Glycine max]
MASRKRKATASRPQQPYDTTRFTFEVAWNELIRRNWHKALTQFMDGHIDVALVKEFYSNLSCTNPRELASKLCIPGHEFVLNAEGEPSKLQRKDLTTLAQTWSILSYSNLAPTSHNFDLNIDQVMLVYGLVMKMDMDVCFLISHQISQMAQSYSLRLGFPALISTLCVARGVVSDSLTFESLSPAINLAYIKKNCWNLDDPTIEFPRTHKARARGSEGPSSASPPAPASSAPAPSTSAPPLPSAPSPTPAPSAPRSQFLCCRASTVAYA